MNKKNVKIWEKAFKKIPMPKNKKQFFKDLRIAYMAGRKHEYQDMIKKTKKLMERFGI